MTRIVGSRCLECDRLLDAATEVDLKGMPCPGDATICAFCGHLMMFDEQLGLRNPTNEEIIELAGDPRILFAQRVCKEFQRTKENL